ncbi:MAG: hypothetical protein A2979_05480 [Deltaproteobacteria bacterium RIFCSPLOWO2_01_FULL_45_74]|nr:MAG: hypothetical protein A3D22_04320 [Deltaproteobacteria bacterium RIFCSPHIGHO2_02_FULL_44_53]OGQ31771.1 MAG: hypothetical protein A2979_05480 [Deltaproteobacteria bacterium RIFCSPLOWO2_01_FULL_45_74]
MLKKIIIFHDLSDASKKALDWGVNFSAYFGSHLKFFYVAGRDFLLEEKQTVKSREIKKIIQKQLGAYESVRQFLDKSTLPGLGRVAINIRIGQTIPTILRIIQKEKPDLVIVGTHGRKGLKHIFLGSVAENVVRYSPVPVLIAKRPPNLPPKKIRGVLIPTDFSKFTEEALLLGVHLSKQVECNLTLAHVIGFSDHAKKAKRTAMRKLQSIITRHRSLKIEPYISMGPVVDEISKAAKRTDSDIILIPTHGHTGLSHLLMGSVAELVVRYSPVNVLSFCPKKQAERRRKFLKGDS